MNRSRKITIALCLAAAIALFSISIETDPAYAESQTATKEKKTQTIKVPQKIYSVAKGAKSFYLNETTKTPATYKSSDTRIAKVTASGKVQVGKKTGRAVITIRAEGNDKYKSAVKKVVVRVSEYKKTNGYLIQGAGDRDGRSGDSSGRETGVYRYQYRPHTHYYNWNFIIRCTDPYISNHAATAGRYIVGNRNFGFKSLKPDNQSNCTRRASVYMAVHKVVGDSPTYRELRKIKGIKKKADTSCTPTVLAGYWLYVDMNTRLSMKWIPPYHKRAYKYYCGAVNVEYHQFTTAINQINKEYAKAGKIPPFEIINIPKSKRSKYFKKSNIMKTLKRGDILCSCPNPNKGGHTVMMQ